MKRKLVTTLMSMAIAGSVIAGSTLTSFAYTVQPGDTLGKIAADNNVTVEQIVSENNIANPNVIQVGQEINIPGKTVGAKTATIPTALKTALKKSFDAKFYAEKNPDVVKELGEDENALFLHFLTFGIFEGRQMNEDFNVSAYASAYDDLREAFADKNGAEQILAYYDHYVTYVESGVEPRTVTTIEKAVEAGITVTSVSTVENSAGTVIASPSVVVSNAVSTRSMEAFIADAYNRSKASIFAWLNEYFPEDENAQSWMAAEAECETAIEKVDWIYSFNYDNDCLLAQLEMSLEASEAYDNVIIFGEEIYSDVDMDFFKQFTEWCNYVAADDAWYEAHPFDEEAFIDAEAFNAAHEAWENVDTTEFDDEQMATYLETEPRPSNFYNQAYEEWIDEWNNAVKAEDYFGEWALATFYRPVSFS